MASQLALVDFKWNDEAAEVLLGASGALSEQQRYGRCPSSSLWGYPLNSASKISKFGCQLAVLVCSSTDQGCETAARCTAGPPTATGVCQGCLAEGLAFAPLHDLTDI